MMKNTKDNTTEVIKAENFSPTKLSSSKSLQGRNLTGSARHVKDLTADIHACIQQWNNLHLQGVSILKAIIQEKHNNSYSQKLQELCDQLENICNTLDNIVENLGQIAHQIKLTTSLHKSTDKLFVTWSLERFGNTAESIHKTYLEEAEIKRKIFENIAHDYTESWKMLHLAGWTYQPALPDYSVLLESLLIETGHK